MRQMIEKILNGYGSAVTLLHQDSTFEIRAFFQPVRSKSWQNLTNVATPLGEVPRGQYVYIGPAETDVQQGDLLTIGGGKYIFRRVEPYWYGDEKVYIWGLCVEKGVNDTWGSQS